jgi:hypothetical protein
VPGTNVDVPAAPAAVKAKAAAVAPSTSTVAVRPRPTHFPGKALSVNLYQFLLLKTMQEPVYDIVFAGDSRTFVTVSPAILQETFPDRKIYNFGFPGISFRDAYLDAIEPMLDPARTDTVIVLGISPKVLASQNRDKDDFFAKLVNMSEAQKKMRIENGGLFEMIVPADFEEAEDERSVKERAFFADGWAATRRPRSGKAFGSYRRAFKHQPVNDESVSHLVEKIKVWRSHGRRVIAYRTPVSNRMRQIENRIGLFEKFEIPARIREAGGIWLDFDGSGYDYYDGHHMTPEFAMEFSRTLAKALREALSQP